MYERFSELLKTRGERPADVTRATGVSSTVFSEWKKGKSQPNVDKLVKIARYLDTTVEYLVTGEDSRSDPAPVLSPVKKDILEDFRKLNAAGREKAADYISDLVGNEKYITDTQDIQKRETSA